MAITCLFLLSCPICWHIIVHSIFLWSLYFCNINCDFSSFTSYFVYLGSHFILAGLARVLLIFIYPFKELALGFIDFFPIFKKFLFYFLSSLYYFLPSANLMGSFLLVFDTVLRHLLQAGGVQSAVYYSADPPFRGPGSWWGASHVVKWKETQCHSLGAWVCRLQTRSPHFPHLLVRQWFSPSLPTRKAQKPVKQR